MKTIVVIFHCIAGWFLLVSLVPGAADEAKHVSYDAALAGTKPE